MTQQHPPFDLSLVDGTRNALKLSRYVLSVLLLALLIAAGWRVYQMSRADRAVAQRTSAALTRSVITVQARPGLASHRLVLPATLRGNLETPLYARTNGYLKVWHKTIGDRVTKGEVLAEIDVPELEYELAQARAERERAEARLRLARSTLDRWLSLRDSESLVEQEVEEKRGEFQQAEADLAAASANVKRLEQIQSYRLVTAPFTGVISRRTVDVGQLIGNGNQELFAITQTDPLRLTIWVPQIHADRVKPGQSVAVHLAGSRDTTALARVEHLAGALDAATRSLQVELTLDNRNGQWLPGAYVEANIELATNAQPLPVVPANTLVIDQQGVQVVVVNEQQQIHFQPVVLGRDFGREVEIVEGISLDDKLVANPSDLLVEGEVVKAVIAQADQNKRAKAGRD